MTKKKLIILTITYSIILSLIMYISWILAIFSLIISLIFYWNLTYIIIFPFKRIKNKNYLFFSYENYKNFILNFVYKIWITFLVLIFTLLWFSYYQNDYKPALMPTYTISNGEKTVVFQGMSHIASSNFYEKIKQKIINYKNDWYVLFFEWVKPWSSENHEKFNKALWIDFSPDLYSVMSELYWLTYQDNSMFLNLVNNLDYNIDISLDEIVNQYENLKLKWNITNRKYSEPIKITESIKKELKKLNKKELELLRYINKAFISIIIKNDNIQNSISNNFWNKELFEVILNKRNEILANEIINSNETKIIVIYWLMHFNWVFEILKQSDIKWHIQKIDYDEVLR